MTLSDRTTVWMPIPRRYRNEDGPESIPLRPVPPQPSLDSTTLVSKSVVCTPRFQTPWRENHLQRYLTPPEPLAGAYKTSVNTVWNRTYWSKRDGVGSELQYTNTTPPLTFLSDYTGPFLRVGPRLFGRQQYSTSVERRDVELVLNQTYMISGGVGTSCPVLALEGGTIGVDRCRLTGYTSGAKMGGAPTVMPIVTHLVEDMCNFNSGPIAARQIAFTPASLIKLVKSFICCDSVDYCPKVETGCLAGGITQRLVGHVHDEGSCPSADQPFQGPDGFPLLYVGDSVPSVGAVHFGGGVHPGPCCPPAPGYGCCEGATCASACCGLTRGGGSWVGSVALAGGTLTLEVCCTVVSGQLTFRLHWSGCGECGCQDCIPVCTDPLLLSYVIRAPACCACEPNGQLSVFIVGNCNHMVFGRHVGYATPTATYEPNAVPVGETGPCPTGDAEIIGTRTVPLIAKSTNCPYQNVLRLCSPQCNLHFATTHIGGTCACMDGSGDLKLTAAGGGFLAAWVGTPTTCVGLPISTPCCYTVQMTCKAELDGNGNPTGNIILTLCVGCLTTIPDGGGGCDTTTQCQTITVPESELAVIDETFTIPICCTNACVGNVHIRVTM